MPRRHPYFGGGAEYAQRTAALGALALAQTVLCFFQPSARPVCFPTEGIWGGAPWLDTRTRNPIPLQKIARVLTGVMKVNEEA